MTRRQFCKRLKGTSNSLSRAQGPPIDVATAKLNSLGVVTRGRKRELSNHLG